MEKLFVKLVSNMADDDLPLQINYEGFKLNQDSCEDYDYNNQVKQIIERRLRGLPLEHIKSLKDAEVLKGLNISIEYLTAKDLEIFLKDGEFVEDKKSRDYMTATNSNPFIIAPYEHGFLVEMPFEIISLQKYFESSITDFGYSKMFLNIIREAVKLGYHYVRFDSTGPFYKEFKR
jgi:hypothetical protein